ncbi:MAG: 4Fe-4S dicluster domain-containing protein [Lachnospiraceae bacterium]|nr:4Fe-4S dicluster domain-containing protein [Lachnospiraceae bacterium]
MSNKDNDLNHVCIENKAECCGCSACAAICPRKAITMTPDEEGFAYPVVDETKCIGCSLCLRTCPLRS